AAYFDNNSSQPQELIAAAQQPQNLDYFILTKVDNSIYHPPMILAPETPINEVTQILKDNGIDAALVQLHDDDPRLEKWPSAHP
ncbi:hypothetical protein OFN64_37770, partial [Escherichia coli]|nr:hypothetical protein [Escherichia coli]